MIEIDEDFRVHVSDVIRAGYCNKGARDFFKAHNLPWMEFISPQGVSAKYLAQVDDALLNNVIEAARKRQRRK